MAIVMMKNQETRDRNFRSVVGEIAGVYNGRLEGLNKMGADPNGWSSKMRDAGVPLELLVEWVREATAAGQRCDKPLVDGHIVLDKFKAWQGKS